MSITTELQERNKSQFSDTPVASSANNTKPPVNTQGVSFRDYSSGTIGSRSNSDIVSAGYNKVEASAFGNDYFKAKWMGIDFGNVTDRHEDVYSGLDPFSKAVDFEQLRKNEQSVWGASANLFTQFVGKTAVNTVGGIVGGFYSLGAAAVQGTKNAFIDDDKETTQGTQLLFDNSVNRGLDKATDWVENNNSVFTSQRDRKNAPLGFFSFESVKDMSDAYSFIAGAVLSEVAVNALSGGVGLSGLPGRLARGASYIDKIADSAKMSVGLSNGIRRTGGLIGKADDLALAVKSVDLKDIVKVEEVAKTFGITVGEVAKARKTLDNFDNVVRSGRQIVTGTFWEAGLEARHTKDDLIASETQILDKDMRTMDKDFLDKNPNYREEQLAKIRDKAETAGMTTFAMNTAVLSASNYIQFPTIFGPRNLSRSNSMAGKIKKDAVGQYVKKGGKIVDIVKTVGSALKTPLTEFTEETLQGAINSGSKSYYESSMGVRTSSGALMESTATIADAIKKGLGDAYGTSEGLHEGIIGAIVGAIGIPMLRKNKKGKTRPSFIMEGGVWESMRDAKTERTNIDDSIKLLNLGDHDTLLRYNKDQAILSSLDADKLDLANITGDEFTTEKLKDNIIMRHVTDRLDKGLKSYMYQDVKEMKDMSIEEYKEKFKRESTLSQEQKDKEVKDFSDKVDIYTEAYEKVYEGLQMDRINNDEVSKKLFDTLVYSISNEKVNRAKQIKLVDKILSDPNMNMSREELLDLAKLDSKYSVHKDAIDEYIKQKEQEKLDKFEGKKKLVDDKLKSIRSKVTLKGQEMLDEAIGSNPENVEEWMNALIKMKESFKVDSFVEAAEDADFIMKNLEDARKISEELNELENNRKKETTFSASKSSKVRKDKKNAEEILKEVAGKMQKEDSRSMQILRGKKNELTTTEIAKYAELREKAKQEGAKNVDYSNDSFLETLEMGKKTFDENLAELVNVTREQVLALEIATNLYGFDKTQSSYLKIAGAQLSENRNNTYNLARDAWFLINAGAEEDVISETVAQLDIALKALKEDFEKFKDGIDEKYREDIERVISFSEESLEKGKDFFEEADKKEEIDDETARNKKAQDEKDLLEADEIEAEERRLANLIEDNTEEGLISNIEFENEEVKLFSHKNLHTIKPTDTKVKELVELKEKIESGEIKMNSGATINYNEDNEITPGFRNYLEGKSSERQKEDLTKAYIRGKDKIVADPKELRKDIDSMDPDVKIFVTHSPVSFKIYDTQVDNNIDYGQSLTIDEDSKVIHEFMYFAPKLENVSSKRLEKYAEQRDKAVAKYDEKTLKNEGLLAEKEISNEEFNKRKALLDNDYYRTLSDIEYTESLDSQNINDNVLFMFRTTLLWNKYKDQDDAENLLKLRLGNITNGYMEKVGDTSWQVEEFSLTGENGNENNLIESFEQLTPEHIVFGIGDGGAKDISDSESKVVLNKGSLVEKTNFLNARMYYIHTTVNGQKVPVLLNRSRIGENEEVFNEIQHQIEEFLKSGLNPEATILLKNSNLSFLAGKTYTQFFQSFLDENNSGNHYSGFDTFNIRNDKAKNKRTIMFGNLDLEINSIEDYEENKDEILATLKKMRYYMDKSSFRKDVGDGKTEFDREFLKFVIDNKMINHSFNTSKNSDKIFTTKPGFQKSIQFHILNSKPNRVKKPVTRLVDTKRELDSLLGRKGKESMSWNKVIANLNTQIIQKAEEFIEEGMADKEAVKKAFLDIIGPKLEAARKAAKKFPNHYTQGLEESLEKSKSIKVVKGDKFIDTYFKVLYDYKNSVSEKVGAIDSMIKYIEGKDYAVRFKEMLLAKNNVDTKLMSEEEPEYYEEEGDDGKTRERLRFKFSFQKSLTEGTPQENKNKFENIVYAFSELSRISKKVIPQIYKFNDSKSSLSSSFLNFTKRIIKNNGDVFDLGYYYTINKKGEVRNKSPKDDSLVALAQYKDKKDKQHNAIEFKYKNAKGELTITDNPKKDFEYDENGELVNGVIYMSVLDKNGYWKPDGSGGPKYVPKQYVVLSGKDIQTDSREYVQSVQVPGLNADFSLDDGDNGVFQRMENLFIDLDKNVEDLKKNTAERYASNEAMKGQIEFPEDSESTVETDEEESADVDERPDEELSVEEYARRNVARIKARNTKKTAGTGNNTPASKKVIDPFKKEVPKKETPVKKKVEKSEGLAALLQEENNEEVSSSLTVDQLESIQEKSGTISNSIGIQMAQLEEGKIGKERIKSYHARAGVKSYEDFVQMVDTIDTKDSESGKKMINFAQKVYDRTDEDNSCIK